MQSCKGTSRPVKSSGPSSREISRKTCWHNPCSLNRSRCRKGTRTMKTRTLLSSLTVVTILIATEMTLPRPLFAHCDGLDGPVVKAAQEALESGNVNLVLLWVQEEFENEIHLAFRKTLAVRELAPEAGALADTYFFETLVRLHRAGEGAPYTGLKPAGRDLGPAIPAADKAIEGAEAEPLLKLLTEAVRIGIREQFEQVLAKKHFDKNDVEAGREYVEAYVQFIHYVEQVYDTAKSPTGGHFPE